MMRRSSRWRTTREHVLRWFGQHDARSGAIPGGGAGAGYRRAAVVTRRWGHLVEAAGRATAWLHRERHWQVVTGGLAHHLLLRAWRVARRLQPARLQRRRQAGWRVYRR